MSTQTKRAAPPHQVPSCPSPSPALGYKTELPRTPLRRLEDEEARQEQRAAGLERSCSLCRQMELTRKMPMAPPANGRKRKCPPSGLGDLHDDMLERILARLPPASFFRLRAVSRRWRAAAASPTFLDACSRVPSRDPWFLMLSESDRPSTAVAFDAADCSWNHCRAAPRSMPVAASGGLVLYRAPATGGLTVANPLTGASRELPPPPQGGEELHAIAMYGAPYRVALFTGELPDLSMAVFDSSKNSWEGPVLLARKSEDSSPDASAQGGGGGDDTVYFLSKSGDVVATNMQRSASKQYSSVVVPSSERGEVVAYFLSHSGNVVACDTGCRTFAELPRILPVYFEYSIDVVACDGAAYAVVLSEYLDTASLRVWEFADGAWRQVAAMPPAMSHGFCGTKADINCVGHGDRVMVCVSSGEANGCFMCDVSSNQWEELPKYINGDGEANEFLAAFSFEPRVEITV
ncbi:F-box only protein 13-like [Phragmites australis]|uniref:F-box only protein 13-like n=1 Tax=Phragmites australis TaxID=29695 RepID=UPI002D785ED7|nr:F-box only protein 13-like [Phragmites australis]